MSLIDKRGLSLSSLSLYIRGQIYHKGHDEMEEKICEKCNQIEIKVVTSNKYCDGCRVLVRQETFKKHRNKGGIGIYKITNLISNKIYIGQSVNLKGRILNHKAQLKNITHYNSHLQHSYNKHGRNNFKFEIIEHCEENELYERENYWITLYNSHNSLLGYNATLPSTGEQKFRMSEEAKKKSSDSKRVFDDEELISYLQEFYYQFGKVPTSRDMVNTEGFPSNHIFFERFGSFKNALSEAGLFDLRDDKSSFDRTEYTKEEVYLKFKDFINQHNRFPNHIELKKSRENNLPTSGVVLKHYKSTEELRREFGFDKESTIKRENEQLLKDLVTLYKAEGSVTSRLIDKSKITKSAKLYAERFGTLENAYNLASVPYVKHNRKSTLHNDAISN